MEDGVGWIAVNCFNKSVFQRTYYRISPELTQRFREKRIEDIADSGDLLQEIVKTVISVCILVFCFYNVFDNSGLAKTYMAFWQDMLDSGEAKEYPFVKDVISAPYTIGNRELPTGITIHLRGESPESEMVKARDLYRKFKRKIDENSPLITSLCDKPLTQNGEVWTLTIDDDSSELQEVKRRLMDRQTGMKIVINTFVKDNCPIIYEVFKRIFAETLN